MTETDPESVTNTETPAGAVEPDAAAPGAPSAERPAHVPGKFWDPDAGAVRTDALVKSYRALERRLGADAGGADESAGPDDDTAAEAAAEDVDPAAQVPESPDGYTIDPGEAGIEPDPAVNARLHEAGFTRAQAQTVYDLAGEYLLPMVGEVAAAYEADAQTERLVRHFGGEDAWAAAREQLRTWGRARFAPEVFDQLSATCEGVLAMHAMMQSGEPTLGAGDGAPAGLDEAGLRALMRDPRYWRDQDPATVEHVRRGFERLYPA